MNSKFIVFNYIQQLLKMAFQVREFEFEAGQDDFIWKFKLGNINSSQLDFYSQDTSSRSLLHLAQDFSAQIQQCIDNKNKKGEGKERTIRKLCEKMLKSLNINLTSFAADVGEDKQTVTAFFRKTITQATVRERVMEKCKKWVIATWLSLSPERFYQTTDKYMQSFISDGKKINQDFELLNELYVITLGDSFNEKEDQVRQFNDNLVLIDINLNIEDKYISQNFLWDFNDISNIRIKSFAAYFLKDKLAELSIELEKQSLHELEKQTRTQLRAQILYKTLLKKYSIILLNFSSVDIPTEVKEYLIPISLKIMNDSGLAVFEDSFQWDILNQSNNVQQFVTGLIADYDLPRRYISQLCYKIRTQINEELEWKFDLLVKTFKSIHKDRQSPKLNTQTISVLRKNLTYAMDVNLPCTDDKYKPNSDIYFNNSDLFSLLSRNIDILPEQFQEILMCKETKNQDKQPSKLSKEQSNEVLKSLNMTIQNNPYIPNLGNTHGLHTIWRKSLAK